MLPAFLVFAVALTVTLVVYLGRERLGSIGVLLSLLRAAGVTAIVLLLIDPVRMVRAPDAAPTVLLDASLSMDVAGGRWAQALDTARVLAGERGTIFRFGDRVAPFDTLHPSFGASRLEEALRVAAGRGGPVYLVTDGELDDHAAAPAAALAAAIVLPRDTVPNAAILGLDVERYISRGDSLIVTAEVGAWGAIGDSAWLEVTSAGRSLARRRIALPPAPGQGRRAISVPAALAPGTHVLEVRVEAGGDREPGDDTRLALVTVAAEPAIVLVARPAGWEARFLVRELRQITRAPVRAFAQVGPGRWVDMVTQETVGVATVERARSQAALVIGVGDVDFPARSARWWWAGHGESERTTGEWYPASLGASPIAARLTGIPWDSLPPLTGLVSFNPGETGWTALTVRLGRRGAERPVVVGSDSAGFRMLVTAGTDLWPWSLRGGLSREAYRALIAAGVDWLLASDALRRVAPVTATEVVSQGVPVTFTFTGDAPPDTLVLEVTGPDSTFQSVLRFGGGIEARLALPPGVYRWRTQVEPRADGVLAVETFSPELPPRLVQSFTGRDAAEVARVPKTARESWWLYAAIIAALVGEWAIRIRRGLP